MSTAIVKRLNAIPGCTARKRHQSGYGMAGDPDVYGSINGRHFELETKMPGEVPDPRQQARLREWAAAGAIVGVVYGVDDAVDIVLRGIAP